MIDVDERVGLETVATRWSVKLNKLYIVCFKSKKKKEGKTVQEPKLLLVPE
jgi:hypothetical protein